MRKTQKKQFILSALCAASLLSTLIASSAFAATSTIIVTSAPYISFVDIPNSISLGSFAVPIADTDLLSDSDGQLPTSRHLTVLDNRGCGGINLQAQAAAFTPVSTQVVPDNLLAVTSTNTAEAGSEVNNIKYLTGFSGDQTATAPLNTASSTFSDPATFTAVSNNSLEVARDIMNGSLTAPTGRNGQMHVGMSFYLSIPKYTTPNTYYTTLSYSLSVDTSVVCP